MGEINRNVEADMAGPRGAAAKATCREKLGIRTPAETGRDVVRGGYGADVAIHFTECVVDTMYPDPKPGVR